MQKNGAFCEAKSPGTKKQRTALSQLSSRATFALPAAVVHTDTRTQRQKLKRERERESWKHARCAWLRAQRELVVDYQAKNLEPIGSEGASRFVFSFFFFPYNAIRSRESRCVLGRGDVILVNENMGKRESESCKAASV